jgi:Major Facilitator Superfamily.
MDNIKIMYKLKNQLLFYMALLLSAFGYEFIYFIMTLHIYELSNSALNVGIFTTLTFIPKLFSSLIGGISDKLGKGKCFAWSAMMIGFLMLFMSNVRDIATIYGIWFIASFFFTVIINTRGTLIAEVISADRYSNGNSIALLMLNAAKLFGPLLGGLIIMYLSITIMFYLTSFVYFSVALCSFFIRTDTAAALENKPSFLTNAKKGFQFMLENKTFGLLAMISFFWRLFLGMQLSLFVIFIKSYLNGTSEEYGFFITVIGLGSIAGSMIGPYITKRIKTFQLIAGGLGLHYASFAILGLCGNYYLSLFIIFISYMFFYMTLVAMHSVRDHITPFEIRSSAYGTVTAILTPPAIVSMLVGSFFTERFNVTVVLFPAGMLALLSLIIILVWGRNIAKSIGQRA